MYAFGATFLPVSASAAAAGPIFISSCNKLIVELAFRRKRRFGMIPAKMSDVVSIVRHAGNPPNHGKQLC